MVIYSVNGYKASRWFTIIQPDTKLRKYTRNFFSIIVASYVTSLYFGVKDPFRTSFRRVIPEKLFKYLPVEAGGYIVFPFTMILQFCLKNHFRTRWDSIEQQAFHPHTDKFKLKIAICEDNLALFHTVMERNLERMNEVIDQELDVNAIQLASMLGRCQMIEYLRDRGADLNLRGKGGNTALMFAVVHQQINAIKLLVESGADLDATDKYGYTALDKAMNRGYSNIIEFLQDKETNPRLLEFNPITSKLESYKFLEENTVRSLALGYHPRRNVIKSVYPYYTKTQGMLFCMFGNYASPDITYHVRDSAYVNKLDDKATSDQQLFSFGDMMR